MTTPPTLHQHAVKFFTLLLRDGVNVSEKSIQACILHCARHVYERPVMAGFLLAMLLKGTRPSRAARRR